jgi:hypothetical protein
MDSKRRTLAPGPKIAVPAQGGSPAPAAGRTAGGPKWRKALRSGLMAFCVGGVLADAAGAGLRGVRLAGLPLLAEAAGLVALLVVAVVARRRRVGAFVVFAGLAILDVSALAVFTGRLGWVGVVAVLLAVTVLLTDPARPSARYAALAAGVFAVTAVLVTNMFAGGNDARTLTIAIAAVIMPLVLSDNALRRLNLTGSTLGQRIGLVVLTVVFAALGWFRADWAPGILHECFTPPTSAGGTVLRASGNGRHCYGLIDTADPGVFARTAFGQNDITRKLETAVLANNSPVRDGDLTIVWMGTLSCEPDPAEAAGCLDGVDYPNERDQLRALLLAQRAAKAAHQPLVHVVIADILPDVAYADAVAKLIVDHRAALGDRLVVMGGSDSRDQTERAINRLLTAGIPFIAPSLLADLEAPGRPFVDRPGYFQLSPPNLSYTRDLVSRLRLLPAAKSPKGVDLAVYQLPEPSDQYTTSLVNDVAAEARRTEARGSRVTVRHISGLDQLDRSICGGTTVVFFADRWTTFGEFLARADTVCGGAGPARVVADGSVSRFMANYHLRATSTVGWPLDYYVPGPGCPSGSPKGIVDSINGLHGPVAALFRGPAGAAFECRVQQEKPMCTLDAAAVRPGTPCRVNELGTALVPALDAVTLAEEITRHGTGDLSALRTDGPVTLTGGTTVSVDGGHLSRPAVKVGLWHARSISDPAHTWPSDLSTDPAALRAGEPPK